MIFVLNYLLRFEVVLTVFSLLFIFANRMTNIKSIFREKMRYLYLIVTAVCLVGAASFPSLVIKSPLTGVIPKYTSTKLPLDVGLQTTMLADHVTKYQMFFQYLFIVVTFLGFVKFLYLLMQLKRLKNAEPLYCIGKLSILKGKSNTSPCAFSYGRNSYVVVDEALFQKPKLLRYILAHEFIHIRKKDTSIVYLLQLIRTLFWYNPLIKRFIEDLTFYQELRTDICLLKKLTMNHIRYIQTLKEIFDWSQKSAESSLALGIIKRNPVREYDQRLNNMKNIPKKRKIYVTLAVILVTTTIAITQFIKPHFYFLDDGEFRTALPVESKKFLVKILGNLPEEEFGNLGRITQTMVLDSTKGAAVRGYIFNSEDSFKTENEPKYTLENPYAMQPRSIFIKAQVKEYSSEYGILKLKIAIRNLEDIKEVEIEKKLLLNVPTLIEELNGSIELKHFLNIAEYKTDYGAEPTDF